MPFSLPFRRQRPPPPVDPAGSVSLGDPQSWPIPRTIHFIWMGSKRILGRGIMHGFQLPNVLRNMRNNPYCNCNLWFDSFSMATPAQLQLAMKRSTWIRYSHVQAQLLANNPDTMDFGDTHQANLAYENGTAPKLREAENFQNLVALIAKARDEWREWFGKAENQQKCYEQMYTPLSDMYRAFTNSSKSELGLTVMFVDLEMYPKWQMMPPASAERQVLSWIYVELYCRGSNYGAASDLLRVQLLIEYGGVYLDHDDALPRAHQGVLPEGQEHWSGFKYTTHMGAYHEPVPVNSFFASPAWHPFLLLYRARTLDSYRQLLANNYKWLDPVSGKPMATVRQMGNSPEETWWTFSGRNDPYTLTMLGEKIPKNFADFTLVTTGPDQLAASLKQAGEESTAAKGKAPYGKDFPASAIETRVGIGFAFAWL